MLLDYVEFYITNVCNLNCNRCNRFNNYAFAGHMSWHDHANDYWQWSKKIQFKRIGILGGEPMAHPDFLLWVDEIAKLWPDSQIMIMTNGTYLDKYSDLYRLLCSYQGRVRIDISRHNSDQRQSCVQSIQNLLSDGFECFTVNSEEQYLRSGILGYRSTNQDPVQKPIYETTEDLHIWQDKSWQLVYRYKDIVVRYADADIFDEAVVRLDQSQNTLYLTSAITDPDLAVTKCACKFSHHFLHGRLYKCGVTAILPEFVKQFPLSASEQKMRLIQSYIPAHWSWSDSEIEMFLQGLQEGSAIPQCGLCPDHFTAKQFAAGTKKIKIQKINS
jgi:organic radical activating enzyme